MMSKMWLLCQKIRAQIWGCLGQMAHRRQIAQWVGTRTTHPGGTGVRTPEVQGISEALPGLSAGGLQRQIGPLP